MFPLQGLANIIVTLIFLAFCLMSFVILYHFTRFGIGVVPKKFAGLFLLGGVLLFGTSLVLYHSLDLQTLIR